MTDTTLPKRKGSMYSIISPQPEYLGFGVESSVAKAYAVYPDGTIASTLDSQSGITTASQVNLGGNFDNAVFNPKALKIQGTPSIVTSSGILWNPYTSSTTDIKPGVTALGFSRSYTGIVQESSTLYYTDFQVFRTSATDAKDSWIIRAHSCTTAGASITTFNSHEILAASWPTPTDTPGTPFDKADPEEICAHYVDGTDFKVWLIVRYMRDGFALDQDYYAYLVTMPLDGSASSVSSSLIGSSQAGGSVYTIFGTIGSAIHTAATPLLRDPSDATEYLGLRTTGSEAWASSSRLQEFTTGTDIWPSSANWLYAGHSLSLTNDSSEAIGFSSIALGNSKLIRDNLTGSGYGSDPATFLSAIPDISAFNPMVALFHLPTEFR